ncbi:flagellar biosynthetic protein FliR [Reinekea thalattae]|uniref:Flagellar biosynthetic protein FliR n=1 Tax=Reinekea thalattae TaxID=2593301 RepID=A0A5C8Z5L9_9GAMM|nr:flagellar biosynthetic protein FliR [Reinekea thalattae]TXR53415.1 flagellar type III secretion system protein FliR [Reinekea thalattae]
MYYVSNEIISSWVSHFMWPFFRISSFFLIVPVLGAQLIPARIRITLAFVITVLIYPVLPDMPIIEAVNLQTFIIIFEQIIIGSTLGFVVFLLLQIYILAGQTISMQMGLGFASMVDPTNGVSVAVISQWYQVLVTLVYLSINGHLLTLQVVVESFYSIPIGDGLFATTAWFDLSTFGSWLFRASLMLALPAISALLLVNVAFGVMTRAAPQLNVFALGFPITMLGGLVIVWASYSAASELVDHYLNIHVDYIRRLIGN